jgi:hypothetical protein
MSIIIKGMKMPKNCDECQFIAEADDYHVCYINEQFIPWEWVDKHSAEQRHPKPSWCPLIEVPKHGDLIDSNVAMRNISKQGFMIDEDGYVWILRKHAYKAVENTPTIIEAEEGEG